MIGDRVRSLVRKALCPNPHLASRPYASQVLLLLLVGCWTIAWFSLGSDLSGVPSHLRAIFQDWNVTPEEMHEIERCLWINGIYPVSATNVSLVKPTGTLSASTHPDHRREQLVVFPSGIDADPVERNPVKVHPMQPVFALPLTSKSAEQIGSDFRNIHDQIKLAETYFRGKRTTVFKTKRPMKYYCRAVLQEDFKLFSHDHTQAGYLSCGKHGCAGYRQAFLTLLPTPPQRRSIWCEELTATEIAIYHKCRKMYGENQENTPKKTITRPQGLIPALPLRKAFLSILIATCQLLGVGFPKFHAFLPVMDAEADTSRMLHIISMCSMELGVLYCLFQCIMAMATSRMKVLATPDCSSQPEEDSKESERIREWLVAASHRLHDHLEYLMEENIISGQQYVDLFDLQRRRGRVYIHAHLRRFVVSNGTVAQLQRYVVNAGINIPDGYESQTSSDSDSTHETSAHPLFITIVSQLFTTAQEGFNFEFALELGFITKHQYVRICDTLWARGQFSAAHMLIRRVCRNQKWKEFLHWLQPDQKPLDWRAVVLGIQVFNLVDMAIQYAHLFRE